MNTTVSVIIITHNRADLLPRAIDSVLNQTYHNTEIIIVDDGSRDDTEQVIHEYIKNYTNIKYIKHEKPMGANAARNNGIKASNGEFIAGLDDDDEFLPNRIEILLKNYSRDYSFISSRSLIQGKTFSKKTKYSGVVTIDTILTQNVVGNQILVPKDIIVKSGLFDEHLKRYQDYDMWIRIIQQYGNALVLDDVTQIIHQEHDAISNNNKKNRLNASLVFYKKHKNLMSTAQKKNQLFAIICLQEKKLSISKVKILLTKSNFKAIVKYIALSMLNRKK